MVRAHSGVSAWASPTQQALPGAVHGDTLTAASGNEVDEVDGDLATPWVFELMLLDCFAECPESPEAAGHEDQIEPRIAGARMASVARWTAAGPGTVTGVAECSTSGTDRPRPRPFPRPVSRPRPGRGGSR